MLSPDPVTQAPNNGQNYNRYSYAYNNPLKYSDPSGFVVEYCTANPGTCGSIAGSIFKTVGNFFGGGNGCDRTCKERHAALRACNATAACEAEIGNVKEKFRRRGAMAIMDAIDQGLSWRIENRRVVVGAPVVGTPGPAQKRVLNNSSDAIDHYFNGNGDPAVLSGAVKQKTMNHPNVQDQNNRNINGTGMPPNRIYINFEHDGWDTFHIGDTKVIYTETCSGGSCSTTFTAPIYDSSGVPDRFQDPLDLGFELPGGVPYEYETFDWSVTYPQPQEK